MKVLIVSHNCFSSSQSMGKTLKSLFSEFNKNEIMQLYLYPSLPNVDMCGDYYRITDKDVLKSIVRRGICGREISEDEIKVDNPLFEDESEAMEYHKINRDSFFVRRVRDLAWSIGAWKSKGLIEWLKRGKPDAVFFAMGDAVFSSNIALWISKYLCIPLFTYVCDEYYFYANAQKGLNRIFMYPLKKSIKKTIKSSKHIVTICESLGQLYQQEFNIPYITIMTGSSFAPGTLSLKEKGRSISYIGNLSLNRWKGLIDIAECLSDINMLYGLSFELVYYGSRSDKLDNIKNITYGGYLSAEQVKETMASSGLLLHVETMDEEYRERLRYSISTKIADSLASGTPVFAYGPEDIASMEHLIRNDCAICVTDKSFLQIALIKAFLEPDFKIQKARKGLEVAKKCHDASVNSKFLHNFIKEHVQ